MARHSLLGGKKGKLHHWPADLLRCHDRFEGCTEFERRMLTKGCHGKMMECWETTVLLFVNRVLLYLFAADASESALVSPHRLAHRALLSDLLIRLTFGW